MTISRYRLLQASIFIAALTFFGACDNSFDPTDRDNGTYSVHGMLDLLEETSYIRVRDINAPFTLDATEELDAIVTLKNLDSGENTLLGSSARVYKGVYQHTFYYDEHVSPDTHYLLRVENTSGIQVELDVLTPTLPEPQILRDDDACSTPVNMVFEPMNGGTLVLRFGTKLDTWGRLITFGPSQYGDFVSITFIPLNRAQGATLSSGNCSSLIPTGNLFVAIAHYSPGFYEQLNEEVTDILKTTRRFGGFYADTLVIPVDVTR